jgi:8-oxo-dGTP diphosphatase
MGMSPYVRALRERVGTMRLVFPSVSGIVRDADGRVLLVRQTEGDVWSTPGGAIDPDEAPADAIVREMWEETGLVVTPRRILGVYGGEDFVVHYANGDEAQYVSTVFECDVESGTPRADGDETADVRYWSRREAEALPLSPWLRHMLPTFYDPPADAGFTPPRKSPLAKLRTGAME